MQLWTEYEGRTIAEAYPLEKLLTPEGRSAFFSTSNGTGTPAVIRIIETHFDEDEILTRWKQVSTLQQPHLITLRNCGKDELDGTALVYAVMEPSDANLADVLKDRALTVQETRDIATSLVAALQTLHEHGLIHEHIEAANVLAVGESVKLRSDCIREVPEGDEGVALKARDVHDLAVVLLQSLTLRHTVPGTALPAPFDAIIRKGISGLWSLSQIDAALNPPVAVPHPAVPQHVVPQQAVPTASPNPAASPDTPAGVSASPVATVTPAAGARQSPRPVAASIHMTPPAVRDRLVRAVEPLTPQRRGLWIGGGATVLLVLVLLWSRFHSTPSTVGVPPAVVAPSSTSTAKAAKPSAASPAKPSRTQPAAGTAAAATPRTAISDTRTSDTKTPDTKTASADIKTQWRVVSYTYNRQDQAQKKADAIASQHGSLHPEVFTVTGHAPYLVTLGGAMTRERATALREQARAAGLPSDTYIQNYSR